MKHATAGIRLGLRENVHQFTLLVVVNAFVGAMVGLERAVLPLLAEDEFGLASRAALRRGFAAFEEMCVVCHGAPGVERGWVGKGMNPTPPQLSEEAEEFSPQELFWVLSNGIKMAGMPALSPTHGEEEILEIVAFLEHLPEMSEDEYRRWRTAASGGAAPDSSRGDGHQGHSH